MTDMLSVVARAIGQTKSIEGEAMLSGQFDKKAELELFLQECAKAAIAAHEKALEAQGLVIVPREPTEDMIEAGAEAEHEAREVDKARFDDPKYVKAGLKYKATAPIRRLPQTYTAMVLAALEGKE